ncbi:MULTISPECIES: response regulator [unclassified Bradyrhizobium]
MGKAVRVLVVEDEAPICSFIEDTLSDGGFEACTARSGEAALSTFRDGREGCRALLTDVNLGDGISGWELPPNIREITPWFPVASMTGASAGDCKSQGLVGSILIEKPFAPAQLATAVSQLVDTGTLRAEPEIAVRLRSFDRACDGGRRISGNCGSYRRVGRGCLGRACGCAASGRYRHPVPQQARVPFRKGRAPLEILQRLARMASLEILADQQLEVGRVPRAD